VPAAGRQLQSSVDKFKLEMDGAGVDWRFDNHSQTHHGFALATGVLSTEYKESADRRATLAMLSLFAEVWPQVSPVSGETQGCRRRAAVCCGCTDWWCYVFSSR
jgi:hypothetical protein